MPEDETVSTEPPPYTTFTVKEIKITELTPVHLDDDHTHSRILVRCSSYHHLTIVKINEYQMLDEAPDVPIHIFQTLHKEIPPPALSCNIPNHQVKFLPIPKESVPVRIWRTERATAILTRSGYPTYDFITLANPFRTLCLGSRIYDPFKYGNGTIIKIHNYHSAFVEIMARYELPFNHGVEIHFLTARAQDVEKSWVETIWSNFLSVVQFGIHYKEVMFDF